VILFWHFLFSFCIRLTQHHTSPSFGPQQFDTNILSPSSLLFNKVHPAQVPGIIPMADVEMLVWDGWLIGILVIIRLAGSQEFTAIHPKVVSLSQQVALNVK